VVLGHADGWDDPGSPHTAQSWWLVPGVQGAESQLGDPPGQAKTLQQRQAVVTQRSWGNTILQGCRPDFHTTWWHCSGQYRPCGPGGHTSKPQDGCPMPIFSPCLGAPETERYP
jgi:hypothetical protein